MINITPLYDRVIVEPVSPVQKQSTILVVETPTIVIGKVIDVGAGYLVNGALVPMIVVKGQLVSYPAYAGTEYPYQGKKYTILKESDVIGIIKE